jgi:WD40 repeat protein
VVISNLEKDLYFVGLKSFKDDQPIFEIVEEVVGTNDLVTDVRFFKMPEAKDPRNRLIAVASNSETLRLYDLEMRKSHFVVGHTELILALDTRKEYLLSGSKDTTIKLWIVEINKNSVIIS